MNKSPEFKLKGFRASRKIGDGQSLFEDMECGHNYLKKRCC